MIMQVSTSAGGRRTAMNTPAVSTRGRPDATGASVTSGTRGTDGRLAHQVSIRIYLGPGYKVAHYQLVYASVIAPL